MKYTAKQRKGLYIKACKIIMNGESFMCYAIDKASDECFDKKYKDLYKNNIPDISFQKFIKDILPEFNFMSDPYMNRNISWYGSLFYPSLPNSGYYRGIRIISLLFMALLTEENLKDDNNK